MTNNVIRPDYNSEEQLSFQEGDLPLARPGETVENVWDRWRNSGKRMTEKGQRAKGYAGYK